MSEVIRVAKVIEVRQTFTPSEPLRDLLSDMMSPGLDEEAATRLRASFLFKSYRRRVLSLNDYIHKERDGNGVLRTAKREFDASAGQNFPVESFAVGFGAERSHSNRVQLGVRMSRQLLRMNIAFLQIPTIERQIELPKPEHARLLYMDVSKNALEPSQAFNVSYTKAQRVIKDDAQKLSSLLYVRPSGIVTSETIISEDRIAQQFE